jgi:hypothetical protein
VNRPRIVAAFAPPTPPIKIDGVHLAAKPTTVDAGRFPVALLWSEAGATGAMIKADASPNNYGDVIRAAVADAVARLVAKKIAVETIHAVVVGGADSARWKTDKLVKALGNAGLADVKTFDLNGAFYRAVRFDPTDGDIQIVREEVVAAHTNPGSASLSLDDAVRGFSDGSTGSVVANATRFFRHKETFTAIRDLLLPEAARREPAAPFTMWCAACSNGVEAYSYAMYLMRLFDKAGLPPRFNILATDINPDLIAFAKAGVYEASAADREKYHRYFSAYTVADGPRIVMSERLKKQITFKPYDLRSRPAAGRFRFVVAANIFQYYTEEARAHFLENFVYALKRPGYVYANPYSPQLCRHLGLTGVNGYHLYKAEE